MSIVVNMDIRKFAGECPLLNFNDCNFFDFLHISNLYVLWWLWVAHDYFNDEIAMTTREYNNKIEHAWMKNGMQWDRNNDL